METLIEMGYEENDPEIIPEIQEMLDEFEKNFDSIRVKTLLLSLIHISEPTRQAEISYAVFCLKKKKNKPQKKVLATTTKQ